MKRITTLICILLLTGCATMMSKEDIHSAWKEVQATYPSCASTRMPDIVILDYVEAPFYVSPPRHLLVSGRWTTRKEYRHAFCHACGDTLGEAIDIREKDVW